MVKELTAELVLARSKIDNLSMVKKVNVWGNDIEDVRILRQMSNVEILSLSVNKINSLREFSNCPKLQELYLRKNNIADLSEIRYLVDLPDLKILWLYDNPCSDTPNYRHYVIKALPGLSKLDNEPVTPEEREAASKLNVDFSSFISEQKILPKENVEKYQKVYEYGRAESNFKNENIICAIVSLLKELDDNGLEFVKEEVEKKLSMMRIGGGKE